MCLPFTNCIMKNKVYAPITIRVFSIMLIFISALPSFSQGYPPFTVNAYDSAASAGYYFVNPSIIGARNPFYNPTQMIVDGNGKVIYYKEFKTGYTLGDFKLQKNGLISYGTNTGYFLVDSTFNIVDSVDVKNGLSQDIHDIQILPNGHILLLGTEDVIMDLSSYFLFSGNGSPGKNNATVRSGVVQELDENKNVVFEWHAKDYFAFAEVGAEHLRNPNVVDWTHFNSIELDRDGNILVSSRHFNEVTKIDRLSKAGGVIWRFGGNANQFTFINDSLGFAAQHDVRRIANGNITLAEAGKSGLPVHPMGVKEYQLDEVNFTAKLIWSHVDTETNPIRYSLAMGNCQRLDNGNTLITHGWVEDWNRALEVVDNKGGRVFEMHFTDSMPSYRCFFYKTLPWKIKQPTISCTRINGQNYLDAGSGYKNYIWSTGDTTQRVQLSKTGEYSVFVSAGEGGFVNSETINVTNVSSPCNNLGIATFDADNPKNIVVYPNPISDRINIFPNYKNSQSQLYNSIGDLVWSGKDIELENFSQLSAGVYILKLTTSTDLYTTKIIKQ